MTENLFEIDSSTVSIRNTAIILNSIQKNIAVNCEAKTMARKHYATESSFIIFINSKYGNDADTHIKKNLFSNFPAFLYNNIIVFDQHAFGLVLILILHGELVYEVNN